MFFKITDFFLSTYSDTFFGTLLIFVCMQRYDALGLLIAAKSIIRFSEKDTAKTEYVLAGTLLSIFIAVLAGLMVALFQGR